MRMTKAALIAALFASGSAAMLSSTSADAQRIRENQRQREQRQQEGGEQQTQTTQAGERQYDLTRAEREALQPAFAAAGNNDWAATQAALPAAQAAATSADGKYLVGQLMLRIGLGTNNTQLQSQAVDAMIASGGALPEELPRLYENQVRFAEQAQNWAVAETGLTRLSELSPNDVNLVVRLAQVKTRLNRGQEADALLQRALQMSQANGGTAPESLYRTLVASAYEARNVQAIELARNLVQAYPTSSNWRDALIIYRELGQVPQDMHLDLYRLMGAAQALTSERDFVEYAEAAERGAMFGEVKTVLEQGLGRNAISGNATYARQMLASATNRIAEDRASLPAERTRALAGSNGQAVLRLADAFYGYGDYPAAVELYRAALQKGGVDAGLVNLRLGAALARAGQRADAETALRAVTGPRQQLASFWLLWLSRQA